MDGLGVAGDFTQVPWVKEQLSSKLGLVAYPGTLNLEITDPRDREAFESLKARQGIELVPEQSSFCSAQCYPVLISGSIKGIILVPLVEDYPKNKMEILAPVHLRKALGLSAGDVLDVEFL